MGTTSVARAIVATSLLTGSSLELLGHGQAGAPVVTAGFAGVSGRPDTLVPDPAIAVGPDRLVIISNAEVAIFTKQGEVVARKGLHPFFLPALARGESSAGDVAALFDEHSQRFFLVQAAKVEPQRCEPGACIGHNVLAVSRSPQPLTLDPSDWHFAALDRYVDRMLTGETPTTNWGDFDKLGVDERTLYITSLQYREVDGAPMGVKIRMVDKAPLLTGAAPTWTDWVPEPEADKFFSGVVPARHFGSTSTFFMVSKPPARSPCGFAVWGISGQGGDRKIDRVSVALDGTCGVEFLQPGAGQGPQPDGAPPIDIAGIGTSTIPVVRNGRLWMADTWRRGSATEAVSIVKWVELDVSRWPSQPTVVQHGEFGEDNTWSFYPSLAVDRDHNLAIAYYATSRARYASLEVVGRRGSDPAGQLRPPIVVKAGDGAVVKLFGPHGLTAQTRNRFADYSWMASDPADGSAWIHGQFGTRGDWRTWVAQIRFP